MDLSPFWTKPTTAISFYRKCFIGYAVTHCLYCPYRHLRLCYYRYLNRFILLRTRYNLTLISTWWRIPRLLEVDGGTKLELAKQMVLIARTKFNEYLKGEQIHIGDKYDLVKVRQPDKFRRQPAKIAFKHTFPLMASFDVRTRLGVSANSRMAIFS